MSIRAPILVAVAATALLAADSSSCKRTGPRWKKTLDAFKGEKSHEPADNSFCYVCHLNYEEEKLVKKHQPAGVGCETCHGMSDKHSEDEDNVVPPHIMFAKTDVVAFCTGCHDKNELLKEEDHEELFSEQADPKDTCTDCHGAKHRLKVRTRRWNKTTGKLIWDDGVRMMEDKPRARK